MVRRPLRYVLAATFALGGCNALLDVKDIYFDPNAVGDGGGGGEGGPSVDGSADGGADGQACTADTMTDPKNCGRCGHSCFEGACNAGTCQAVELASITNAPLDYVVATDQYVFVSTDIELTTQVGGVWRVPKTGGQAELYSPLQYSSQMAILGDKLYFVVEDKPKDGTPDQTGGLYSCPLTGPAPCAPTLIAPATNPASITVDKGKVFYGDDTPGKGLMEYAPPAPPTVFRDGYGFSRSIFVDGQSAFYVATLFNVPQSAKLIEIFPDAGFASTYAYESPSASAGRVTGDTNAVLFTAYDFETTNGGVVRRISRTGAAPCSIGGSSNRRPYGIYADAARVYWTNQGDGASRPYTNGSLTTCEQAGCCTVPKVLWTGDGEPTGIVGDGEAIYFVTHTKGSVWKIAKP